ncbi:atic-1 [Pristionchus pacificus]|uniref:Atic-1 n=1 Tax=Pristionchus pacificus TaxID=54126 RepID=A0A2A6BED6_PRIPA|nr:atic-1 [Pristionchus pacificus]|eukprot:PDM64242.1 atic-1 [Pristionchus pacificus]
MSRISSMAYKKVDGMTIDDRRRSASNSRLYNRLHSLHSGRSASTNSSPFNSKAFQHTFSYDDSITGYLSKELREDAQYLALKYGMTSHQGGVSNLHSVREEMPVKVLNGSPGYINILDALNGWQMVKELREATGIPSAASFKHVTPAGAAIGIPLSEAEAAACMVSDLSLDTKKPSLAAAYARARGADRMSSFGDMIALSDKCDEATAKIISREVSEGVVAPDYDHAALSILVKKKGGNYTVFKIDPQYLPSETEERTIFGLKLRQKRNNTTINGETFANVVSENKELPKSVVNDLIVATIAIKYAQSNSVCIAHRGQVIGLGAGQQSRIHCTRLAADKAANWFLRQHPRVLSLPWRSNLKRSERATGIEMLIESGLGGEEERDDYFTQSVPPLTLEERSEWLKEREGVVLSSDGTFPANDNMEVVMQCGVRYIAQPGGSTKDQPVIDNANRYGVTLIHTGLKLFHH